MDEMCCLSFFFDLFRFECVIYGVLNLHALVPQLLDVSFLRWLGQGSVCLLVLFMVNKIVEFSLFFLLLFSFFVCIMSAVVVAALSFKSLRLC